MKKNKNIIKGLKVQGDIALVRPGAQPKTLSLLYPFLADYFMMIEMLIDGFWRFRIIRTEML